MRPLVSVVLVIAAVAAAVTAWSVTRGPEGELAVCLNQTAQHQEEAFDGPVTNEQIEQFCRSVLDSAREP